MKRFLFIVSLLTALLPDAKAQDYLLVRDSTILTNQDTQITNLITLNAGTKSLYGYSVHIVSDSLTGSTAGTVTLQGTNDGVVWYTISSLTLDGAAQQNQVWTGTLYARRLRVYAITPSGSKTIRYRVKAVLKKSVAP